LKFGILFAYEGDGLIGFLAWRVDRRRWMMVAATKPLNELTADELMSRDVVMVPENMSLRAAANLLSQAGITGAPVVNSEGRCIGVISATDFVNWAKREQMVPPRRLEHPCYYSSWQVADPESLPVERVGMYMTPDPVTVEPCARIAELARKMLDAHIHRLIVVDEHDRPVGVISSTDIFAALARGE
jgi:CBS domain-containing protein